MNTMNDVEMCLRGWAPRRPSPGLGRRLFGASREVREGSEGLLAPSRPSRAPGQRLSWLWLSPVAACLLAVMVSSGFRPDGPVAAELRQGPLVAMILSNQSYAAYLPGSFQRNENRWDTFDWTNTGGFPSSDGPFERGTRNGKRETQP